MKLILTQAVDGLGTAGDVVEVKDGYGRNFLQPRGLAVAWTKGGEKQVTQIKRAQKAKEIRGLDHAKEVKAALEATDVKLVARAGDSGKLFGSITAADVAVAVRNAGGPALDKRALNITKPIKAVGKHKVQIKLHDSVTASIVVDVVAGA
jgi:large subunit ribosomal protein L9